MLMTSKYCHHQWLSKLNDYISYETKANVFLQKMKTLRFMKCYTFGKYNSYLNVVKWSMVQQRTIEWNLLNDVCGQFEDFSFEYIYIGGESKEI